MRNRLRPAASLAGTAAIAVVAALAIVSARLGPFGGQPLPSPTPPQPTRAANRSAPTARPTQRLVTLPPANPTLAPTAAPIPEATPWPEWLQIPERLLGGPDDPDRDGLKNARERQLGTDEYGWDSDYGGEQDGREVAGGRDPLDRSDDVPERSACIPENSKPWDIPSSDDTPPPAPELERLLPHTVAGANMTIGSMRGLPRTYGAFFNYIFDGILMCAGGQPEDLSHAIGVRGDLPAFAIFAIHIDGADHARLARDLLSDLEAGGNGRSIAFPVDIDGRLVRFLYDGDFDSLTFATYVHDDVLYLMTGLSATDAGLWAGGTLDPEHVRDTVTAVPPR